jgi:cytochrome d ubiquinol oxidase subunit I
MHYPLWTVPHLGGALVIASIAIFHVVIAHFAVGAGIFNALTEIRAYRKGDLTLLRFVRDNSLFLIYLAFVAGAVSGVGIWFSIELVAPEATTFLIRLFLWVWAIEWVFFIVELASGYIYYFTWDRLSRAWHIAVGVIYAVAAFMSLVMINGILAFMLTPGQWLHSGSLWDAWFNPSFLPSLCMRTVSALALAGIFVAVVATMKSQRFEREERARIIAWGARFLVPLALMPVLAVWYFSVLPASARSLALGGAVAMTFFFMFGVVLSLLIALYALFGMLLRARDVNLETALLMAAIAFLATGSMEFVREGIRKPYVLHDVMYSNGIMVKDVPMLDRDGVLARARWVQPDTVHYRGEVAVGEAMYRTECMRCHEIDGYNALRPLVKDWNYPLIMSALDQLDKIKPFMPPFVGTQAEKEALGKYLLTLTDSNRAGVSGEAGDTVATVASEGRQSEEGSEP